MCVFFLFKQKTAYEMRISDWSSDVCSSDLAPVVVQSMTNTDTADVASTVKQVADLWRAGSELVRVTVNNPESAAAVPRIVEKLAMMGIEVPVIGDFHY